MIEENKKKWLSTYVPVCSFKSLPFKLRWSIRWLGVMKANAVSSGKVDEKVSSGKKNRRRIESCESWGLGVEGKKDWVMSIIRGEKPDVIGLQETKSGLVDNFSVEEVWGNRNFRFTQIEAKGSSGDIDEEIPDIDDNFRIDLWSETEREIRLRMRFECKAQLKKALALWSLENNREFKVVESKELPCYIVALEASNLNIIVKWLHHQNNSSNIMTFKYIFWAFGPSLDAFHQCGPVICVDGTHLQGGYKGRMLIAVTKDANNCILPVAYAIDDEETNQSWSWFLEQFRYYVAQDRGLCVVSDRIRGIINAMMNIEE
ncbi:uncharacterized protein Tco_1484802 [Tanacetum coccineum]